MPVLSTDLTTLANVKQYLAITTDNDDQLLQTLISNESLFINQWCSRQFMSQNQTEIRNGSGSGQIIAVNNWPITAVTNFQIYNKVLTQQVLTETCQAGYRFDDQYIYLNGFYLARGVANIQFTYTAGYTPDNLPLEIVQAANELVAFRYKETKHIGKTSEGLTNQSTGYITKSMPDSVAVMLQRHKRVTGGY